MTNAARLKVLVDALEKPFDEEIGLECLGCNSSMRLIENAEPGHLCGNCAFELAEMMPAVLKELVKARKDAKCMRKLRDRALTKLQQATAALDEALS